MVDEVLEAVSVDESKYESVSNQDEAIAGLYKEAKTVVQVVEPAGLVDDNLLISFEPACIDAKTSDTEEMQTNTSASGDSTRSLFFYVQNEKFAIELELLRELIFIPNTMTQLANGGFGHIGVVTIRDELINAIDFNLLLGFGATRISEKSRFLIIQHDQKALALCVQAVEEVKDLDSKNIDMLSDSLGDNKISGLYKDCDGSIVSIVSNNFLKELIAQNCITNETKAKTEVKTISTQEDDSMSEIAVFAIGDEEFALDIEDVQEIIRYQETTPIPEAPEFIEGVINLRGSIVSVLSLPQRLGFDEKITDKSKIVVSLIDGEKIGFLVDDVNEILFVEDKFISRNKNQEGLIKETITLNGGERVILKLNIQQIVSSQDLEKIKIQSR